MEKFIKFYRFQASFSLFSSVFKRYYPLLKNLKLTPLDCNFAEPPIKKHFANDLQKRAKPKKKLKNATKLIKNIPKIPHINYKGKNKKHGKNR